MQQLESYARPIVCGDYTDIASIQGAMLSGRLAGDSIIQQLSLFE
jgi:predicted NAD/FAD-dependent oxidoreductase